MGKHPRTQGAGAVCHPVCASGDSNGKAITLWLLALRFLTALRSAAGDRGRSTSSISFHSLFWLTLQPWLLFRKGPRVLGSDCSPDGELGAAGPYPCCTHANTALKPSAEIARTGTGCTHNARPLWRCHLHQHLALPPGLHGLAVAPFGCWSSPPRSRH